MTATQAAPHKAKKEKSRVYSFFLLSYTLILLVSLSSCLFFGAEVAQQLRREEALNKQALLTSLKNDVEDINDLILQSAPGGAGEDEFAVIKSTLLNQMRSDTELRRIIDVQRPAVVRDLLDSFCWGRHWTGTARAAGWRASACAFAGTGILWCWPRRIWTAPFSSIPTFRWKTIFPWRGSCCKMWAANC